MSSFDIIQAGHASSQPKPKVFGMFRQLTATAGSVMAMASQKLTLV